MKFDKRRRQKIIDGYLADTGRNLFIAAEFIDWLADRPDHEAYDAFYGIDDSEAARQYRIDLARRWVSNLRIVVRDVTTEATVARVTVREFPAYISPIQHRTDRGGYVPFDPNSRDDMAELRRQAGAAMKGWLSRYRHAFPEADLSGLEAIAAEADIPEADEGHAASA